MYKKQFIILLLIIISGMRIFAQEWFDMSMPYIERKARLVSTDYDRAGYRAAVNLINQLSGNKAFDVSGYLAKEITSEQVSQISEKLFLKTGKLGTYLMVADQQSGNTNSRYYYIVCIGWEYSYIYAYVQLL